MIEKTAAKSYILFIFAMLVLGGCKWGSKLESSASVNSPDKLLVINVLAPSSYNDAHIAGSINVPLADLHKTAQTWDKNTPIVVYCSNYMCSASTGGARILKNLGFTNVSAYEGGMAEWYQLSQEDNSFAFEGPAKEEYLTVKLTPLSQPTAEDITIISAQELRDKMQSNKGV